MVVNCRVPVVLHIITYCGTITDLMQMNYKCWPTSCVTHMSGVLGVCPSLLQLIMHTLLPSEHVII
jgi:hypothetical protein